MQAVLLAAGKSSRFYPYRSVGHKAGISLFGKPLIVHTLDALKRSGIANVVIIVGPNSSIRKAVEGYQDLPIQFAEQKDATGMGDALLSAREYLDKDFFLLHAHHLDFPLFYEDLLKKKNTKSIVLLGREDTVLNRFGLLSLEGDRVIDIVEKPEEGKEPSNIRVIGIYLLNKEFIDVLETTPDHHDRLEHAIATFAKTSDVRVVVTDKPIVTLKYPWDLLFFKDFLFSTVKPYIDKSADISKDAVISGDVIIESGAKILEGAKIKGPCFIGKNAYVGTNAILRNGTVVEEDCVVGANMEVKNSILFSGTKTHAGFIGDSIVGRNCHIAAGFISANVRLDRASVKVKTDKGPVDTNLRSFGVVMGNGVKTGIRVSTMPGVVIGSKSIIGPSTTIFDNIPENTQYMSMFQKIQTMPVGSTQGEQGRPKKHIVLFDIDYTLFDTDQFKKSNLETYLLYDEVLPLLQSLKNKVDVGIFSEGETEFQMQKLLSTKIHKFFTQDHTHIVSKKEESLEQVLGLYADHSIILVDDKLPVLFAAKAHNPSICTIWIKRGMYASSQEPILGFEPDATVSELSEVAMFVNALISNSS